MIRYQIIILIIFLFLTIIGSEVISPQDTGIFQSISQIKINVSDNHAKILFGNKKEAEIKIIFKYRLEKDSCFPDCRVLNFGNKNSSVLASRGSYIIISVLKKDFPIFNFINKVYIKKNQAIIKYGKGRIIFKADFEFKDKDLFEPLEKRGRGFIIIYNTYISEYHQPMELNIKFHENKIIVKQGLWYDTIPKNGKILIRSDFQFKPYFLLSTNPPLETETASQYDWIIRYQDLYYYTIDKGNILDQFSQK